MAEGPFLAVDWGTTNRRAFRLAADGVVEETVRDDAGVTAIAPGGFEAAAAAIRVQLGDLPMLCAGMVGSNRGWVEVPYAACPAGLSELADSVHWLPDGRTAIVPGVSWGGSDRVDVMRGEEVQFLGALARAVVPDVVAGAEQVLLCQPGTHCKWAHVGAGQIEWFATAMTGELFSLIQRHSLLAPQMTGKASVNESFRLGIEHAREGGLPWQLFSLRADNASGRGEVACGASYVSGLLIGSDVKAALGDAPSTTVCLLADEALGGLYAQAIGQMGGKSTLIDSHAAFVAGITKIWSML